MAQDDRIRSGSGQDRQQELEAGFLDWLGSFPDTACIDDLVASVVPVVDEAMDSQD
jgi:hypothetical protein